MVNGTRRKYKIVVSSPPGLNLISENEVNDYIRDHITDRLMECVIDYVSHEGMEPQVIKVPGEMHTYYKKALKKELNKTYIDDSEVFLNGIRVESSCKYTGTTIVLEYWDDEEV